MSAPKRRPGELARAAVQGFGVPTQMLLLADDIPPITARRQRVVESMVRDKLGDPAWTSMSPEAQLLFVVAGLICDEAGRFAEAMLWRAATVPGVLMIADGVLRRASAPGAA